MALDFLTLQTEIKEEGRLNASDDLSNLIKSLINEYYRLLCNQDNEYSELVVVDAPLVMVAANKSIALPADFRKEICVQFADTDPNWYDLKKVNQYSMNRLTSGYPQWYFIAGSSLHFFPYLSIVTSNAMRITYRKRVTDLVADEDLLLVPDLWATIKRSCLARLGRYHADQQKDVGHTSDAGVALNRTDR